MVSSIRYTKAVGGNGLEQFFVVGDGTNSAIWMWDDLSQGYGVSSNELTYIYKLENFHFEIEYPNHKYHVFFLN